MSDFSSEFEEEEYKEQRYKGKSLAMHFEID